MKMGMDPSALIGYGFLVNEPEEEADSLVYELLDSKPVSKKLKELGLVYNIASNDYDEGQYCLVYLKSSSIGGDWNDNGFLPNCDNKELMSVSSQQVEQLYEMRSYLMSNHPTYKLSNETGWWFSCDYS